MRKEDHKLQVFEFGGRLFGEVMCTFGGVSSAGMFDDIAKVVKRLAEMDSRIDKRMVNQVLDDVVGCGSQGDGSVSQFYTSYREIAKELGISIADESDVDKAFKRTHTGKVLGISYDLKRWVWWLSEDKLTPLIIMLGTVRDEENVTNGNMMSLNGKLNHYMWLLPGGPWQQSFLLNMQDSSIPSNIPFKVNELAKEQAGWWIRNIRMAGME